MCAAVVCGCAQETGKETHISTETVSVTAVPLPVREKRLYCPYYNELDFEIHTRMAERYGTEGEILCGTVPHHLLAGQLIAEFLSTAAASREKTDTVVITATMHYPKDEYLCTSFLDWDTPFGTAYCDKELTGRLVSELGAEEDNSMPSEDHSVSALVPYVKSYFPDSEIAVLLVGYAAGGNTPERISDLFKDFAADKSCLFVFSADFSHYLEPDETEKHDCQTLEAVMSRDYEAVSHMTDSNVDSPYCLGTFMRLSDALGGEIRLVRRSNSLEITDMPYNKSTFPEGLTSYFVFVCEGDDCAEK